jgi:hypothetical protein
VQPLTHGNRGYSSTYAFSAKNQAPNTRPGYEHAKKQREVSDEQQNEGSRANEREHMSWLKTPKPIDAVVGMEVEVNMCEEGLVGSRYPATICELRKRTKKPKEALVEYSTLFETQESETPPALQCDVCETEPEHALWTMPGVCGTPGCDLPDHHTEPCTPFVRAEGSKREGSKRECMRTQSVSSSAPNKRLREWVDVSSLVDKPDSHSSDWHKCIKEEDVVEMRHNGGFWRVAVHQRLQADPQRKKGVRFAVQVEGYSIERIAKATELRPCAS